MDSPRDLEEGLDWVHLGQRGVSICQLDGGDAQGPHVAAGVVRVVVLLLAGYDLPIKQHSERWSHFFSAHMSKRAGEATLTLLFCLNFVSNM